MTDENYAKLYEEIVNEIRGSLVEVSCQEKSLEQKIPYKILPGSTGQELVLFDVEREGRKQAALRGAALVGAVGILSSLVLQEKPHNSQSDIASELHFLLALSKMYMFLYKNSSIITLSEWRRAMRMHTLPFLASFYVEGVEGDSQPEQQNVHREASSCVIGRKNPAATNLLKEIVLWCHEVCEPSGIVDGSNQIVKGRAVYVPRDDEDGKEDGSLPDNHLKLVLRRSIQLGRTHRSGVQKKRNLVSSFNAVEESTGKCPINKSRVVHVSWFQQEMIQAMKSYISQDASEEW